MPSLVEKIKIAREFPLEAGERWMLRVGPFGVRPILDGSWGITYNITHALSGMAITNDCCCVVSAVRLAEALAPLWNWDRTAVDLAADPNQSIIARTIRDWKCPACEEDEPAAASARSATVGQGETSSQGESNGHEQAND